MGADIDHDMPLRDKSQRLIVYTIVEDVIDNPKIARPGANPKLETIPEDDLQVPVVPDQAKVIQEPGKRIPVNAKRAKSRA